MDIQVRDLKAKDVKTLVKMFGKLSPAARTQIAGLIKPDKKKTESDVINIGLGVFQVIGEMTEDAYIWLADMAGMKPEELDDAPPTVIPDIIAEISHKESLQDFLTSVSRSLNKTP